jgi:hypothetical protein
MAGGPTREQTDDMLTPIVTEIPRALEPVGRDTFIAAREPSNVVRLVVRERPASVVPARAA